MAAFPCHFCADVSQAMNELTGVSCDISEQHKDTTTSRLKKRHQGHSQSPEHVEGLGSFWF